MVGIKMNLLSFLSGNFGRSSNGRTHPSGGCYLGSSPSLPAILRQGFGVASRICITFIFYIAQNLQIFTSDQHLMLKQDLPSTIKAYQKPLHHIRPGNWYGTQVFKVENSLKILSDILRQDQVKLSLTNDF